MCSHRSIFQSLASLKASTTMHDAMAARVMSAPVGWFERTPLGRILNRFSSDIQEIDKDVMEAFSSTLVCTFSAISIVVVISYTVGVGLRREALKGICTRLERIFMSFARSWAQRGWSFPFTHFQFLF